VLQAPHHYRNSRAIWDHSVTCHPAEVTFPPLPQPIKASTRFSNPRRMQGWVDLVGLVTCQGGIPDRIWSPIPVLNQPWCSMECENMTSSTKPKVDKILQCHSTHTQQFYVPLSGTTRVCRYQKRHSPTHTWNVLCESVIILDFMRRGEHNRGKCTDNPAGRHPIRTIDAPTFIIPSRNPPNLSWLGTGTKYAGLHTWRLGHSKHAQKNLMKFSHIVSDICKQSVTVLAPCNSIPVAVVYHNMCAGIWKPT